MERQEPPGQARAINYLGVCVWRGRPGVKELGASDWRVRRNMEMPLQHREWEGEERSVSACVSQPVLDTTGSWALTACKSPERGSSVCAWGGCYPEMVVYMCPCVRCG